MQALSLWEPLSATQTADCRFARGRGRTCIIVAMGLIDARGRLLGVVNLIDAAAAIVAAAAGVAGYLALSAPHRVETPFGSRPDAVWYQAEVQAMPGQAWLCDAAAPGVTGKDPRNGAVIAEVIECTAASGTAVLQLRLRVVLNDDGHPYFRGRHVRPGRPIEIDADACYIEGVVRRVAPAP